MTTLGWHAPANHVFHVAKPALVSPWATKARDVRFFWLPSSSTGRRWCFPSGAARRGAARTVANSSRRQRFLKVTTDDDAYGTEEAEEHIGVGARSRLFNATQGRHRVLGDEGRVDDTTLTLVCRGRKEGSCRIMIASHFFNARVESIHALSLVIIGMTSSKGCGISGAPSTHRVQECLVNSACTELTAKLVSGAEQRRHP